MKIKVNPVLASDRDAVTLLDNNFIDVQKVLTRIRTALAEQRKILDKIDPALRKNKITDQELTALADELDRISENCSEGNLKLLSGRAGYRYAMTSIWIITGVHMDERERIYIQTMTAASLGIRRNNSISSDPAVIKSARERVDKVTACMDAYSSRFRFTADTWKDRVPASYSKIRLEREIKKHQADYIKTAQRQVSTVHSILIRLKELAKQSAGKNFTQNRNTEIEVSALIDEIDRIASQASFNRFRILQGEFSEKSRYASLWFLMDEKMEKRERIFLKTITAYSLGLKDRSYRARRISDDHSVFTASVDNSIKSVGEEIKRLQGVAAKLEKCDDSAVSTFRL